MRIAVVVVNYLSSELIAENIAPLSAELGCDVIIVDNYSKAHETAQVQRLAEQKGWHLEASPINLGFGAGMNVGARIAMERGADALLLLNPDAKIDAANVMELADAAPPGSATMASPRILRPDGTIWFAGMTVSLSDGSMTPTRHGKDGLEWLTGACLWIPVTAWARVGGFDEDYFLYWEDVDLSVRAERAGVALRVVSNATAFHDAGGSQQGFRGQREKSPLYYYFNIRNRLLFADKLLDADTRRRWRRNAIPESWRILLRGGRRQLLRSWRPLTYALWGLTRGLANRR